MRKSGMAPVYVGDIGVITRREPKRVLPKELDLSKYSFRDLCNIAILVGIDLRDIIGISSCSDHRNMVFLGGKELPDGYNIFEHCVYCKNCWQLFRIKNEKGR
jgi:hypothetical protein